MHETSGGVPCHKVKESQSIWQKATSLRQSFRHSSSKYKVSQKTSSEHSLLGDAERGKGKLASFRREWGSQRNLSRERRSIAATGTPKSREPNPGRRNARSLCVSGEWDIAPLEDIQPSTSCAIASGDQQQSSSTDAIELPSRHQRSPRKLTKDSGYETSAQGDPDYINALDWPVEENPNEKIASSDHRGKNTENHGSQEQENCRITSHHR